MTEGIDVIMGRVSGRHGTHRVLPDPEAIAQAGNASVAGAVAGALVTRIGARTLRCRRRRGRGAI